MHCNGDTVLDRLGQLHAFEQDSNTDSGQESNTDSHSARRKARAARQPTAEPGEKAPRPCESGEGAHLAHEPHLGVVGAVAAQSRIAERVEERRGDRRAACRCEESHPWGGGSGKDDGTATRKGGNSGARLQTARPWVEQMDIPQHPLAANGYIPQHPFGKRYTLAKHSGDPTIQSCLGLYMVQSQGIVWELVCQTLAAVGW